MLGLGFGEIVIICILLIVVVGPERLPSVMKGVGKTMRSVRQASRDLRGAMGIDEILNDDLMRPPPPRPMKPPLAAVPREPQLEPPVANAPPSAPAASDAPGAAGSAPARADTPGGGGGAAAEDDRKT